MDNLQYQKYLGQRKLSTLGFKPYYKWIIFNIIDTTTNNDEELANVLNLIING